MRANTVAVEQLLAGVVLLVFYQDFYMLAALATDCFTISNSKEDNRMDKLKCATCGHRKVQMGNNIPKELPDCPSCGEVMFRDAQPQLSMGPRLLITTAIVASYLGAYRETGWGGVIANTGILLLAYVMGEWYETWNN